MKEATSQKPRVVLVTKCIPPYRYPVFKKMVDQGRYDLKIFSGLPLEHSVKEARENLRIFHPRGLNLHRKTRHQAVDVGQKEVFNIPVSLPYHIYRHRPDIIIAGNMGPTALISLVVAKLLRIPFVIWTEEIKETADSISSIQAKFRKILLPRTDAFLAWGRPAHNYMLSQGYAAENIYYCAQAVDNERWIKNSNNTNPQIMRDQLGISGRMFLLLGQMIERKGFSHFLRAWAKMPQDTQAANHIVFAGEGEDLDAIKALAQELNIPNYQFLPLRDQEQLPELYAAADVLVFPSLVDVWGMVVNEALACGTPVLASKHAGSSQELINLDGPGELIDPLDITAFSKILEGWTTRDLPTANQARQAIRPINFDVTVEAFNALISEQLKIPAIAEVLQ